MTDEEKDCKEDDEFWPEHKLDRLIEDVQSEEKSDEKPKLDEPYETQSDQDGHASQ